MTRIYMSPPDVGALEEEYVVAALRSGWIAPLGPDVTAFEREVSTRLGVDHAVALSSGTAGLHLGLLALGVGAGDVVITATLTFAATANAIVYTGARPVFVDCLPSTGNMNPELLESAIRECRDRGERIAAIVPVDLLGKSADYSAIEAIATKEGIPVLADAAESLGATHRGRPAGSFGKASVLSFNGNKIMTTSGGGMLLTDDERIAEKVRYLATQARQPVEHYEHTDIGYNYRLSNILAALGRAQLTRLDDMISRRRAIRGRYRELFATVPGVEIFGGADDAADNCWLTAIRVDPSRSGWGSRELAAALGEDDIESRPLWKPMHCQPVFADSSALIDGSAEAIFETGITLPSGSALSDSEFERVVNAIARFIGASA